MHHEEFGERLMGVLAGFLLYTGKVTEGPHAIVVIEKITGRQLGAAGREIVAVTLDEGIVRERTAAPRGGPAGGASSREPDAWTASSIKGLRELGVHGVLPEEQTRPQPFEVDVELDGRRDAARASPTTSTTPSTTPRSRRR